MKKIQKPWIKIKETIEQEDYNLINKLQEQCIRNDQTTLKLELDYKLGAISKNDKISCIQKLNEFMYYDGQEIIGYIGICSFGVLESPIEVNGMVHPAYRGQGVFRMLSELVISEWKRRNLESMLLLCDRKSSSGQAFIKESGAQYKYSEYEMYLKENNLESFQRQECGITLRKATNEDAYEIARQNIIYFNNKDSKSNLKDGDSDIISIETEVSIPNKDMILPEEEEKRGMTIYLAQKDEKIIGKVHIQLISRIGGIYGLGVLPEHRGKGFGREILIMAIEKLKEENAMEIMLQVATENSNALDLYSSCGFKEISTMDYYEITSQ